jgi:hypothetical protein
LKFESPTFVGVTINNVAAITTGKANLTNIIREGLKKLGAPKVTINSPYLLGASARFEGYKRGEDVPVGLEEMQTFIFTITGQLLDGAGNVLETIAVDVSDAESFAAMFGGDVEIDENSKRLPIGEVVEGFSNEPVVKDNTVLVSEESTLGMQILVNGTPANIVVEDGMAIVKLDESDVFQARAINNSDYEVASELTLDGIQSNHYRGGRFYRIIEPGGVADYRGWELGGGKYYEFKITPFEQSVAAELGEVDEVGVITMSFRRAFKEGEAPLDFATKVPPLGVGKGELLTGAAITTVKRVYGPTFYIVTVRFVR